MDRLEELGVHVLRGSGLNRDVAEQLGVPAAAIEVVDRSAASTFSEALAALQYARDHGYASILLVTSKYHTKRAAWIYRTLAGDSIRIISRPAREDSFDPNAWWHDRASTRRVFVEYQKLLVFLLVDQWKAPQVSPNNQRSHNPTTSSDRVSGRTVSAGCPEAVSRSRSLS
jgi:uncharacterized SAM-binding protein YcdF (DUF218 family)